MYYFIDIVCSIAEVIFLIFLAGSFFDRRERKLPLALLSSLAFLSILLVLSYVPSLVAFRTVFWAIAGTLLIRILFRAKLLPAFFACAAYIGISGLADIAIMVVLSFFSLNNQALMEIGTARTIYVIIAHIIQFILLVAIRFIKGIRTGELFAKNLLPACPCLLISILFCAVLASDISGQGNMNPLYLVVAIGMLYTCIVVILYTIWLQDQQNLRHSLELANHHYAMQKEYYEQLHAQQEQTRALWHDMKKYLRAIETDNAAEDSLHQLEAMVDSVGNVVDVNSRVVSIILNEYIQAAKDAETEITLDVQVPAELPITAADLYILLGNTLDNALDACASLEKTERMIALQLRLHNGMLFYHIRNPYTNTHFKRIRNQFHGYGLKNVRECVKRHDGSMETSAENNIFEVSILINCT